MRALHRELGVWLGWDRPGSGCCLPSSYGKWDVFLGFQQGLASTFRESGRHLPGGGHREELPARPSRTPASRQRLRPGGFHCTSRGAEAAGVCVPAQRQLPAPRGAAGAQVPLPGVDLGSPAPPPQHPHSSL